MVSLKIERHRVALLMAKLWLLVLFTVVTAGPGWAARAPEVLPLHIAVQKNDVKEIERLVQSGVDPNQTNERGETPLHLSIFGRVETTTTLLKLGANPNVTSTEHRSTPLLSACGLGRIDHARHLLLAGASPNTTTAVGFTCLQLALNASNPEQLVALLLKSGADPNQQGYKRYFALETAMERKQKTAIDLLLKAQADPNLFGDRPLLEKAVLQDDDDLVEKLLSAGANPNLISKGYPIYFVAVKKGSIEILERLIRVGIDVNAKDKWGDTALIWAARAGDEGIVSLLLDQGADVAIRNYQGRSALDEARRNGHRGVEIFLTNKQQQ